MLLSAAGLHTQQHKCYIFLRRVQAEEEQAFDEWPVQGPRLLRVQLRVSLIRSYGARIKRPPLEDAQNELLRFPPAGSRAGRPLRSTGMFITRKVGGASRTAFFVGACLPRGRFFCKHRCFPVPRRGHASAEHGRAATSHTRDCTCSGGASVHSCYGGAQLSQPAEPSRGPRPTDCSCIVACVCVCLAGSHSCAKSSRGCQIKFHQDRLHSLSEQTPLITHRLLAAKWQSLVASGCSRTDCVSLTR